MKIFQTEKNSKATAYPFRLGTTSYIYPDHILPNVRKLQSRVDDVELLLFEADQESNLPGEDELSELAKISEQAGLSYTVHLPLDVFLGDCDETVRRKSVAKVIKVIRKMQPLRPFGYNLHFEKWMADGADIEGIDRWKAQLRKSCEELFTVINDFSNLAIETLNYPFEWIEDILVDFNFSIILDIGHMIRYQMDYEKYLQKYIKRTRVIHLHGVHNGKDHLSLAQGNRSDLVKIFKILKKWQYRQVLTLEVFSKSDLDESMQVVEELWNHQIHN